MRPDDIEAAMTAGVRRALDRRAAVLREGARDLTTTVIDQWGRAVQVATPEATVMLSTAALFAECSTELAEVAR